MIVANLIEIGEKIMELLSKYDIRITDYKHLQLFRDYLNMEHDGYKITYIVTILSERYALSEASVYRILRKFRSTVKT